MDHNCRRELPTAIAALCLSLLAFAAHCSRYMRNRTHKATKKEKDFFKESHYAAWKETYGKVCLSEH